MTPPLNKILHIDDDAVMRMMVKKALERSQKGFDVISCATAYEFLDTLKAFQPDLLLVDIVMPIMTGPDLLAKVRSLTITTPAIFMTGQDHTEFKDRAALEPILGIIQKPFSPTQLGDNLLAYWNEYKA